MKHGLTLLFAVALLLAGSDVLYAQKDKEEKKEERTEKKEANKDKVDCTVFRRQILALPEFSEQRRKLAEIRNAGKGIPKIYAVVDSMNINEDGKSLSGFIQIGVGDNVIATHELVFDRTLRKIVVVKPTGEKLELEKEPVTEKKKQDARPRVKKKNADEDEEDGGADEDEPEEEDEKPTKKKQKDDDD